MSDDERQGKRACLWQRIQQEIAAPFQEVEAVLARDVNLLPVALPQADGDPGDENDHLTERAGA